MLGFELVHKKSRVITFKCGAVTPLGLVHFTPFHIYKLSAFFLTKLNSACKTSRFKPN